MSKFQVACDDLQFNTANCPVHESLTGELVVKTLGVKNPKDFIVIQWLQDGNLQTLHLDEAAKLDGGSDQRFIVFEGSSTYPFEIDNHRFEWGSPKIRGDVLKKLISVDPTQYGVWQQSNNGDDKQIDNDKIANLKTNSLEVFFTAKFESTEGSTP